MSQQRIQRAATRAPVNRPIELQVGDLPEPQQGICVDISIGGLFVETAPALARGTIVKFALLLPEARIVRGLAEVVWSRDGETHGKSGVGMKFRALEQNDRQMVFKLVSRHIKKRLAHQSTEEEDAPAPIKMVHVGTPREKSPARGARQSEQKAIPHVRDVGSAASSKRLEDVPKQVARSDEDSPNPVISLSSKLRSTMEANELQEGGIEAADRERARPFTPPGAAGSADSEPRDLFSSIGPAGSNEAPPDQAVGQHHVERHLFDGDDVMEDDHEHAGLYRRAEPRRAKSLAMVLLALLLVTASLVAYFTIGQGATSRSALSVDSSSPGAGDVTPGEQVFAELEPGIEETGPVPPDDVFGTPMPAPNGVGTAPPEESGAELATETPPAPPPPEEEPEEVPTAAVPFTIVEHIEWQRAGDALVVTITLDGASDRSRYQSFRLEEGGYREVIRFKGVAKEFRQRELQIGGPILERIRTGFHSQGSGRAGGVVGDLQVVFDLSDPSFRITSILPIGTRIEVTLEK